MIEIKNYVEEMVLKIITDAKTKKYKFDVAYPYTVKSCFLDQICAILLKLNISVELRHMTNTISNIEIVFVTSNKAAKFKYTIDNIDSILEGETNLNGLNIDEELEKEMSVSVPNIIRDLRFDNA